MPMKLMNRSALFSLLLIGWWGGDARRLNAAESAEAARPKAADGKATEPTTDEQRRSAAVALNYSRAALHRIRKYPCARIMVEERDKILNHLNLNGVADEEVMKLYSGVLDEIAHVQMADREKEVIQEQYVRTLHRDLGISTFTIAAEVATAQYFSAVKTGASSWWDHRNKAVSKELDRWQVDKKLMTSVVDKSTQFLDISWKMARTKQIPDRWLVRNDDLDRLENAWRENDPKTRLRILKRMQPFLECYPPYWYYVARTEQSLAMFADASLTYEKLASLSGGHFRKDEMLAAGLANRAYIQAYLQEPGAADTAARALTYSTDAWEANLICASILQKQGRIDAAEDAILRNLDVNLERSQSRVALIGLYYQTNNRPELAARLTDPEWVREVPIPQLILCAGKLSPATPQPIVEQIQLTMQGTPRLNFGRDDFVLSASPAWQLQNANVALHLGDKTYTNPRFTHGQDSMLVSFDGITKFGGRVGAPPEDREVAITIKYPHSAPVRLTLKPGAADGQGPLALAGRSHPVYRAMALEQEGIHLSLRQGSTGAIGQSGPTAEFTDVVVPTLPASIKQIEDEAPDSGDGRTKTLETPSFGLPGNPGK